MLFLKTVTPKTIISRFLVSFVSFTRHLSFISIGVIALFLRLLVANIPGLRVFFHIFNPFGLELFLPIVHIAAALRLIFKTSVVRFSHSVVLLS